MEAPTIHDVGVEKDETSRRMRVFRALEFTAVFIGLPLLYLRFRDLLHPIPVILCLAAGSTFLLKHDGFAAGRGFLGESPSRKQTLFMLGRFAFMAMLIVLFTLFHDPGRFLTFPRTTPVLWLIVMVVYPLFSVFPQGIIFRAFFFHRYKCLFGKGWGMIGASGIMFCFAHIIFLNPVALLLTLVGGIMFAHTYLTSKSLWFSSLEHALYGNFVFTIGLGYYIYQGAMMH